ncbi:hypothetical protein EI94DRAFT_1834533, partial [Lactarius quietus]
GLLGLDSFQVIHWHYQCCLQRPATPFEVEERGLRHDRFVLRADLFCSVSLLLELSILQLILLSWTTCSGRSHCALDRR